MKKNIRNFCIISHIDHGKSTLADRFLEITGTIPKEKMKPQFLDMMALERERGITIKMQPVRMEYEFNFQVYNLNLIDTPGHIDFSYEVSRGLAAVEGAILLVDATKGIQAQTIHHLTAAKKQGLTIIPVVNKIDLPQAEVEKTKEEIRKLLNSHQEEILEISAKLGINVEELLRRVIQKIPPPQGRRKAPLRALIFDSQYDPYKGVIAFVRIIDGEIEKGEQIFLLRKKIKGEAKEIGYFNPEMIPTSELKSGEIGYIATGIKEPDQVRVGDTITIGQPKGEVENLRVQPLPDYREPKLVVFASIYPQNPDDFPKLQKALSQLQLTDPALHFEPEKKTLLGQGFRCSFLGNLHVEIVFERLKREFNLSLIISPPQVIYKILEKDGSFHLISSAKDFPEHLQEKEVQEKWIRLEVLTPQSYSGPVLNLLKNLEGQHLDSEYLGKERLLLLYETPLREIMDGFYNKLKSVSQGFASFHYKIIDWRKANLVKLEVLIAGKKEEFFSQIVPLDKAFLEGKKIVKKLKEILPRQQFPVALQAKVKGKIIARETIPAQRKDVIAPLYGGDYSRKKKLLEKQKKGKKRLKAQGKVRITPEVFLKMFRE